MPRDPQACGRREHRCCPSERYLLDGNDNHVKVVVEAEENGVPQRIACKIFFATQFEAIRTVRDAYAFVLSLSVSSAQDMHGGKSGARGWGE